MMNIIKKIIILLCILVFIACEPGNLKIVNNGSGGVITSVSGRIDCGADCEEDYDESTIEILTAKPDSGYGFWGWTGDCSGDDSCIVSLNRISGDKKVTAVFRKNDYSAIEVITQNGGRLDYHHENNLIIHDRLGEDGFYDVYIMNADGTDDRCITCNHPDLPAEVHIGQPEWHPGMRYFVFQVAKQGSFIQKLSWLSSPGIGVYNDLWLFDLQTNRAEILREVPKGMKHGVLHPHFNKLGTQVSWSEMKKIFIPFWTGRELGGWELMIADFDVNTDFPSLKNIHSHTPGDEGVWYENHGFDPTGKKLIFTSNFRRGSSALLADIYTLDIESGETMQLTTEAYNEHAGFSPDSKKIVWMSTREPGPSYLLLSGGTDYWMMNSDGSNKQRITFLNNPFLSSIFQDDKENTPEFIVADLAWKDDSKSFYGYLQVTNNATTGLMSLNKDWIIRVIIPE